MKRIVLTSLLLFIFTATGFAQSDKLKEKANEKVEELNSQIIAGDETLGLTEEQKEQIFNIHIERMKEYKKLKKDGASEEDLKAVQKKHFQKIYNEVLTKEQKKARKKGKEKQ